MLLNYFDFWMAM